MCRETYEAIASQDGFWWNISVPQLDLVGQSPTRDSVETVAREIVGLWLAASPDSFEVEITISDWATSYAKSRVTALSSAAQ